MELQKCIFLSVLIVVFVPRVLFASTYIKLKDSYWTGRVQTQVYPLVTDARAAQRELAGITEAESIRTGVSGVMGYRPFP